jgi:ribosomal protein L37AE/L43A
MNEFDAEIDRMNKYKCSHCVKVVERDSEKLWLKSYCIESRKYVHIMKQK